MEKNPGEIEKFGWVVIRKSWQVYNNSWNVLVISQAQNKLFIKKLARDPYVTLYIDPTSQTTTNCELVKSEFYYRCLSEHSEQIPISPFHSNFSR